MPAKTRIHWSKLSQEELDRFLAYLDTLPEEDRPVYAIDGRRSSLWQKMGGGTKRILVFFYPDRVVVSTRGMVSTKEINRKERPLTDITDIRLSRGPLFTSVAFRFADGGKTKLVNVRHQAAEPVDRFMASGLDAFDRRRLDPEAATDFFHACNIDLMLPEDLLQGTTAS